MGDRIMRYIGSKTNLLEEISTVIHKNTNNFKSFCDIFTGTGAVSRHFKKDFSITCNDILYFSHLIQKATIEGNSIPEFLTLKNAIALDPYDYFSQIDESKFIFKNNPFFYENYAPSITSERQYFSPQNALRIDAIRQTIEIWKDKDLLSEGEYCYLLAGLIEAVPFVSNIAGTYGAYLKHWDRRALKVINPIRLPVENNNRVNCSFNKNANDLIKEVSGDILYIDPPYNGRQYISNYHILETLAKYDNPEVKGITGVRRDSEGTSNYCKKSKVRDSFHDLIENADFKFIVVSYSTEGIMSEDEITSTLEKFGCKSTLTVKRIPYRRYKHTQGNIEHKLNELIFSIKK